VLDVDDITLLKSEMVEFGVVELIAVDSSQSVVETECV